MDNKKGMIFGKLNIIDLAILLIVAAGVAFFVVKFMTTSVVETETKTFIVTYFEEECADFVPTNTHVGDSAFDGTENHSLGMVTDVIIDESISYSIDPYTEKVTLGTREGYSSVYITTEVEATPSDNGFVIDGTLYSVGHTVILHAGYGKYYLPIFSIEEK